MVLEELNVEYRDVLVDMSVGAQNDSKFLALNPRGMVPVLIDEQTGGAIAETGAILLYLTERVGRLAPEPQDHSARSVFFQRLFFLSNTLHADAQVQYYTSRYVGDAVAESARPQVYQRMRSHFAMLEEVLASYGRPWLLGERLSVCDFYLAGCVRWSLIAPRHAPLEPEAVTRHPKLNALLAKLEERDSVIKAFELEGTERSAFFREPKRSKYTQKAST